MNKWPTVELGTVATIDRTAIMPNEIDESTPYVGVENIDRGGTLVNVGAVGDTELSSAKFRFSEQQILFGKLRPYLAKVSRPNFSGVCSTDILPISPGSRLDKNYLNHFLLLPSTIALAASRTNGANLPRLAPTELAKFRIPLPPIDEQRRIAQVLDSVDGLRTKRRRVINLLDDLTQSIFLDIFGDPTRKNLGWQTARFGNLLEEPLHNGLSPSKTGIVQAKVLTLSAITGPTFDPLAFKIGTFKSAPPSSQAVRSADFLICRGNGNLKLVGRGLFPLRDMPDTTFPDTIISAHPSRSHLLSDYLQFIWKSPVVRHQIESLARTTNGTFKINQTMLESVELPLPPLELQAEFGRRIKSAARVQAAHQAHLAELHSLFASLQYRAFRGELGNDTAA